MRRAAELTLELRRGHRRLAAGDPAAAAFAFRRAAALAPERPRIRDLLATAERQAEAHALLDAEAERTAARLTDADRALAAGRLEEALAAAETVLAAEPGHPQALDVAEAARASLDRRRRSAAVERPPAEAAAAAAAAAVEVAAGAGGGPLEAAAPPDAPGSLTIEFVADLPEGTLLIAANGRRIVDEPFSFYDRVGMFKKKAYRGKITVPARAVEPGAVDFKIWVAVAGEAAHLTEISGNFLPGVARRLDIHLTPDGGVTAALQ
jgi:hypothetical protein